MLEKSLIILLFCTSIINGEFSESSSSPVGFGGDCNKTAKCDPRARLTCNQGTCQCMKQDEMVFDVSAGKCLVKAGERCIYILGERGDNSFYVDPYSCVPGASCSEEESSCTCNQDFYETSEGTCSPAGLLGESCTENRHCSGSKGFQCVQGTCQCDSTSSEYSSIRGHCVGLAGSQCIRGQCTAFAECATNMCVCHEDYFWDVLGHCRPKFGLFENCTADFQCQQEPGKELKCVKGVCNCDPMTSVYASVQRSYHRYYDPRPFHYYEGDTFTQCVALAGRECIDGLCAPRAYCSYFNGESYDGTCRCEPSLTLSKRNTCGREFHGECTTQDECIDDLACVDNRCQCEYKDHVYDALSKSCLSKFGGPCHANSGCMKNSYCRMLDAGSTGHCVCNEGFVPDSEDSCDVAGGGRCQRTADCDSVANLECVNGLCQCRNLAHFDPIHRKCVGKVGAQCSVSIKNDCVKNSNCEQTHPKLPARCVCNEGYSEMPDYTCHLNEEEEESEDANFVLGNATAIAEDVGE